MEAIIYQDQPVAVKTQDEVLFVTLGDGRVIGTPLAWYPFLTTLTPAQLENPELLSDAIYWEAIDEGLSIKGMLEGIRPRCK